MTLRYKLVTVHNEEKINRAEVQRYLNTSRTLGRMFTGVSPAMAASNSPIADIANRARRYVQDARSRLRESMDIKQVEQFLKVESERTWNVFNEYTGDSNTMYGAADGSDYINEEFEYKGVKATRSRFNGKPTPYKVDVKVPYNAARFDEEGNEIAPDPKAKGAMIDKLKKLREEALAGLRDYRKQSKTIATSVKEYNPKLPNGETILPFAMKYTVQNCGGLGGGTGAYVIHIEKGDFMRLKEAARLREVFTEKTPKTSANHVGIEIEFVSKGDKEGVATALAKRNLQSFVCLKTDGSLRKDKEYQYTHELCIIAEETVIHEVLKGVIDALDEVKCAVNKSCGLHVHLDMRSRDKKIAFYNLVKSQNILYAMNPASRLTGEDAKGQVTDTIYSKRVETSDFDEAMKPNASSGSRQDRYLGINPFSFTKHKTIEVRIHSGSTNYNKISNWVKVLVAVVNSSAKNPTEYVKPEAFCEKYELDSSVLSYINERVAKFKNKDGRHITLDEAS